LLYPLAEYLDASSNELRSRVPEGFAGCLEDPVEFTRWAADVEAQARGWPREEVDLHTDSLMKDHV